MQRRRFKLCSYSLAAIVLLAATAFGQQGNVLQLRFPGVPTGGCAPIMVAVNNTNGDFYDCGPGSVWRIVGPGPGGITGFGTINSLPKFTAPTVLGDSLFDDDGARGRYTGANGFQVPGTSGLINLTCSATTPAAAGDVRCVTGAPARFHFYGAADQTFLTNPLDLYGSAPAALLPTKAAGADPTTGNLTKWGAGGTLVDGGASSAGVDCTLPGTVCWNEEFGTGGTSAASIGSLGWPLSATGTGTAGVDTSKFPNMGVHKLVTGATATNYTTIGGAWLGPVLANLTTAWRTEFIWWYNAAGDYADSTVYISITDDRTTVPATNGCYLRAIAGTDTNYQFFCKTGGSTSAAIDSGVAIATTNPQRMTIYSEATKVWFKMSTAGGAETTPACVTSAATGCVVVNFTFSTGVMGPAFYIVTNTTAAKNLDVDAWKFYATGLAR